MRRILRAFLLSGICFVALSVNNAASAQPDPRVTAALGTLGLVMTLVWTSVFAIGECAEGDVGGWFLVISTIDRRHANCVKQDARWAALSQGWEKEEAVARARKMVDAGVGSFAYIRAMEELPRKIPGPAAIKSFCSAAPWKILLKPNAASAQELETFAEPINLMSGVRSLGLEREWADAPCDKSFWPPDFVLKRR